MRYLSSRLERPPMLFHCLPILPMRSSRSLTPGSILEARLKPGQDNDPGQSPIVPWNDPGFKSFSPAELCKPHGTVRAGFSQDEVEQGALPRISYEVLTDIPVSPGRTHLQHRGIWFMQLRLCPGMKPWGQCRRDGRLQTPGRHELATLPVDRQASR